LLFFRTSRGPVSDPQDPVRDAIERNSGYGFVKAFADVDAPLGGVPVVMLFDLLCTSQRAVGECVPYSFPQRIVAEFAPGNGFLGTIDEYSTQAARPLQRPSDGCAARLSSRSDSC
jgi:hypothetical protein